MKMDKYEQYKSNQTCKHTKGDNWDYDYNREAKIKCDKTMVEVEQK